MDIIQIGTVVAIVVICYLVGIAAKLCPRLKDEGILVIVRWWNPWRSWNVCYP